MHILVLATDLDLHADAVIYHLNRIGVICERLSPTDIADSLIKVNWTLSTRQKHSFSLESHDCGIVSKAPYVFCREFSFTRDTDNPEKRFAQEECWSVGEAYVNEIESSKWFDHYRNQLNWDNKIRQYSLAMRLGIKFPETIITNQLSKAKEFTKNRRCIVKQLSDIAFAPIDPEEGLTSIYTNELNRSDIDSESLQDCPALIQELIEKRYDIRYYYIDGDHYAFKINSQESECSMIDFRRDHTLDLIYFKPNNNLVKVVDCIAEQSGLKYMALDFAEDLNGEFVFFEFNPTGNWLWIEQKTEIPLSKYIAKAIRRHFEAI